MILCPGLYGKHKHLRPNKCSSRQDWISQDSLACYLHWLFHLVRELHRLNCNLLDSFQIDKYVDNFSLIFIFPEQKVLLVSQGCSDEISYYIPISEGPWSTCSTWSLTCSRSTPTSLSGANQQWGLYKILHL